MASFHLNVFFNCPFFSRSIRSMCKESKNKTTTKKQQGKKIDARSTRQPSYLPPLTTLSRGTCKYRDWQVTHAHYSPWFWAQTSPRPALFWRAGLSGKTQLSLQEKPLFPQISVQIQDHNNSRYKGLVLTLPILERDTAQAHLSRSLSCPQVIPVSLSQSCLDFWWDIQNPATEPSSIPQQLTRGKG